MFHRNPVVGVCSVNIYRVVAWPRPFLKIWVNQYQIWFAHSTYYLLKRTKHMNFTNGLRKEIKTCNPFNYQNSIFYCLLLSADLILPFDGLLSLDSHKGGFMKNIMLGTKIPLVLWLSSHLFLIYPIKCLTKNKRVVWKNCQTRTGINKTFNISCEEWGKQYLSSSWMSCCHNNHSKNSNKTITGNDQVREGKSD